MAVKKTAKKITKKMTKAKKTVPKLRAMSVKELTDVMAKNHAKAEAAFAKWAESHAKTEASIDRLSAATQKLTAERQETEKLLRETIRSVDRMSANVDALSKNIGNVNNRLGRLVEFIVAPKIRHDINAHGHNFDRLEVNKLIRGDVDGRKEDIAEVDVLLCSPTEAMAIETKTRLRESHVKDHLDRLQDLREHEEDAEIEGKKLFGAVIGVVVDDKARALAKENGLYVVEIREEEDKLKIDKPERCRIW
jgi:hypothetical protein